MTRVWKSKTTNDVLGMMKKVAVGAGVLFVAASASGVMARGDVGESAYSPVASGGYGFTMGIYGDGNIITKQAHIHDNEASTVVILSENIGNMNQIALKGSDKNSSGGLITPKMLDMSGYRKAEGEKIYRRDIMGPTLYRADNTREHKPKIDMHGGVITETKVLRMATAEADGPTLFAANSGMGPTAGLFLANGVLEEVTKISLTNSKTGAEGPIISAPDVKTGEPGGIKMVNMAITGLRDGVAPQDAVNVRQLKSAIADATGTEGSLSAALSALKPMQYDPYEPTQLMAGFGSYGGKQAFALGVAHYSNERVLLNAGIALQGSRTMGNMGITYKFGWTDPRDKARYAEYQVKRNPISHIAALEEKVAKLETEKQDWATQQEAMKVSVAAVQQENDMLRRDNTSLRKDVEELKKQVAMLAQQMATK